MLLLAVLLSVMFLLVHCANISPLSPLLFLLVQSFALSWPLFSSSPKMTTAVKLSWRTIHTWESLNLNVTSAPLLSSGWSALFCKSAQWVSTTMKRPQSRPLPLQNECFFHLSFIFLLFTIPLFLSKSLLEYPPIINTETFDPFVLCLFDRSWVRSTVAVRRRSWNYCRQCGQNCVLVVYTFLEWPFNVLSRDLPLREHTYSVSSKAQQDVIPTKTRSIGRNMTVAHGGSGFYFGICHFT